MRSGGRFAVEERQLRFGRCDLGKAAGDQLELAVHRFLAGPALRLPDAEFAFGLDNAGTMRLDPLPGEGQRESRGRLAGRATESGGCGHDEVSRMRGYRNQSNASLHSVSLPRLSLAAASGGPQTEWIRPPTFHGSAGSRVEDERHGVLRKDCRSGVAGSRRNLSGPYRQKDAQFAKTVWVVAVATRGRLRTTLAG